MNDAVDKNCMACYVIQIIIKPAMYEFCTIFTSTII